MQKFVWFAAALVLGYIYGAVVYLDWHPNHWPAEQRSLWLIVSFACGLLGVFHDWRSRRG